MVGTFTRDSVAWRQVSAPTDGSTPFLEQVASDVLRLDNRGDGCGPMILLEPGERTNLVAYSEDLTMWGAVGPVINAGDQYAPDGDLDACVINFGASAAQYIYSNVTGTTDGDTWRVFFWAKMKSGGGDGSIRATLRQKDGATFSTSSDVAINESTWTKVEATLAIGTGANLVRVGVQNATDAKPRDVVIWGFVAQLENGSTRARGNSYIKTTGSQVTQAIETLTFSTAETSARMFTKGFWIQFQPFQSSAEMLASGAGAVASFLIGIDNSSANGLYLESSGGTLRVVIRDNSTTRLLTSALTFDADQNLAIRVQPLEGEVYCQGFTSGNGAHTGTAWEWPDGEIAIGRWRSVSPQGGAGRYYPWIVPL